MLKVEDIFKDLPILETERLLLRKINMLDLDDIFEYCSDPEMVRYTSWEAHESIENTNHFIKSMIEKYENHQIAQWGVVHKEDKKVIGTCGFSYWIPAHGRAEIAGALSGKYWGKGYMTEAFKRVFSFGFDNMKLNRIEGRLMIDNKASTRMLEKLGMQFEGILRGYIYAKGKYHDLGSYSIIRRDFYSLYNQSERGNDSCRKP